MRIGIITSELFDPRFSGIGGFGWATRRASFCLSRWEEFPVEPVIIMVRPRDTALTDIPASLDGIPLLWRSGGLVEWRRRLRTQRFDLLLAIDNQAMFRLVWWLLPRTPLLVWARDPKTAEDRWRLQTLCIPGDPAPPQGLFFRDMRSFRYDVLLSRLLQRPVEVAAPTPHVVPRIPGAYGLAAHSVRLLPNPLEFAPAKLVKSERPLVLIAGRLDPVKRPWIAWEVARSMPDVDFLFLGKNHFSGAGTWHPPTELANVRMVDHLEGPEKWQCFEHAWFLLNTSIHEGLPVTFQEALAWEAVIISSLNPEGVPERFGACVGDELGDGLELVPRLVKAICELSNSPEERIRLAKAGRAWVESIHGTERFRQAFREAVQALGFR